MELPIHAMRDEIVRAVIGNQVTIVVGETGSGKTTQIPVFLYEAGFAHHGRIGVTEPRRIAATSVAYFVAGELGTEPGAVVGYQVRFDSNVDPDVAIKFMTDGILLREFQGDPMLSRYSVIMVDEAHERSENIDFVLGLLKGLLAKRSDLKVVIASATIDSEKFSRYFGGAPIIKVSGQAYPVEVIYQTREIEQYRMIDEIAKQVVEIHSSEKEGDILVFLEGKSEIGALIRELEARNLKDVSILPAYSGISPEEQEKIFLQSYRNRKIVVATNMAETSITIEGIRYVVDSGRIKENHFNPNTGIGSLDSVSHSKAGCDQRKGRAGRTQPGVCYRMYTEADYLARREFTEPEIRRVSIAGVVLALKDLGIGEVEKFDFIDPPDPEAFREAHATLIALGAIAKEGSGITELGRKMAKLPLDPRIARMLLEADKYGCVLEVATVAAFLSVAHVLAMPQGKEEEAKTAHRQFKNNRSDALTFLEIWKRYVASNYSSDWCYKNFLNGRSLREIESVREQLFHILDQCGMVISESDDEEKVVKSVVSGLLYNLFRRQGRYNYSAIFRNDMYADSFIHPSSGLFGRPYATPEWIVATEVVRTKKTYARNCTEVNLEWLPELLPHLFFWTEPRLVSYRAGDDHVVARQDLVFQNQIVRCREVSVAIEEARRLQDEACRKAEAGGLLRLTFVREEGWQEYVTANGEYRTRSSAFDPITISLGGIYYCEKDRGGYGIYSMSRVTPKFQVLDLGSGVNKPFDATQDKSFDATQDRPA